MRTLNYFTLNILHYNLIHLIWISLTTCAKPPTMSGEPLNPLDFEKGTEFVMDPTLENDMTINDGTMNDIIETKKIDREKSSIKRWPKAIIPYMLDISFDETERAMIAKAIQLIQDFTCFHIISRTTESNYILIRKNINSTSCSSNVGMIGGKQRVNLAPRCIQRFGSTAHEFMHAMGFYHEQSRSDRDQYVNIFYENIMEGRENNFELRSGWYGNLKGPYDTLSITHYSRTAFSKNGKDTIQPVKGNGELGQRKGLTKYDIDKVNEYYKCDKIKSKYSPLDVAPRAKPICKDFNESDCRLWAYYGYCTRSTMLMPIFCKKTCKKCDMGCVDMSKKCKEWVKKKYCNKYSDYMYHYCARSCKKC